MVATVARAYLALYNKGQYKKEREQLNTHFTRLHKLHQKLNNPMPTQAGKDTCLLKHFLRSRQELL